MSDVALTIATRIPQPAVAYGIDSPIPVDARTIAVFIDACPDVEAEERPSIDRFDSWSRRTDRGEGRCDEEKCFLREGHFGGAFDASVSRLYIMHVMEIGVRRV